MRHWIGIRRAHCFSPASVERDEAVFAAVCGRLEKSGYRVACYNEEDHITIPLSAEGCFSMARSEKVLNLLAHYEQDGGRVLNAVEGVRNCRREVWTTLFSKAGIPQPSTCCLDVDQAADIHIDFELGAYWMKRSDACSQKAADVCLVTNSDEFRRALQTMKQAGLKKVVMSAHVAGDLVKFYGVSGTSFFYTCYPTLNGETGKFGWEKANGMPRKYTFNRDALQQCCEQAACLTGLTVYGGDCIVDEKGCFWLIDWNDWPSFSPCLEAAAEAIAMRLLTK